MRTSHVFRSHFFGFWSTLLSVLTNPQIAVQQIDIPLEQAIRRSRWYTAWSCTFVWLGASLHHHVQIHAWIAMQFGLKPSTLQYTVWLWDALLLFAFIVVSYGFLRLYTLISHVLTINVFKTRGQRLRLLNLQTSLLTLLVPISAGYIVRIVTPVVGGIIMAAASMYAIGQLAYGYNQIFHKRNWRGLGLWFGSTMVTWFVLAIGALAIAVTFAVISFFVLAILRPFAHH